MKAGFVPALVTPLDEKGNLIERSYRKQIEDMIAAGAVGLLSMGSMGQQAFLTNSTCVEVARVAVDAAAGRVPVFVGAMDCSIRRAAERMLQEETCQISAIDIHSHVGPAHGNMPDNCIENGSVPYLLRTMELANIAISVNSSRYALMPRGSGYCVEGNRQMVDLAEQYAKVYFWVIIDPHETETFAQAADLLQHPKALGVKIHPEEHEYSLLELGDKLFAFAAKHHAPLLGHSGAECCMPEIYSFFAEQYPEIPVIAAHLGSSFDADPNHHIRSILNNQTGNLYTDTSSIRSMLSNLLEYAVGMIGADHILFGTDSSNYFSPCQRVRIDGAAISRFDKYQILRGNALKLFAKLDIT